MASIEEKYKFTTIQESVTAKGWAAGSSEITAYNAWIYKNNKLIRTVCKYPRSLYTCFDEPIVNAIDHFIRQLNKNIPVTSIEVKFTEDGMFMVRNNGPGVEVVMHNVTKKWVPTMIFGDAYQGSNLVKPIDNIIGGTNGLGAKISNYFSTQFTIETYDSERKLHFIQTFKNGKYADEPVIKKCNMAPFTCITFRPDYDKHWAGGLTPELYETMRDVIYARLVFAKIYMKFAGEHTIDKHGNTPKVPHPINVSFNGRAINYRDYVDMFTGSAYKNLIYTVLQPPMPKNGAYRYKWEVIISVGRKSDDDIESKTHGFCLVNGIMTDDCSCTTNLTKKLMSRVSEKYSPPSGYKIQFVFSYCVSIFINAQIPNPAWSGQIKNTLNIDSRKLEGYQFSDDVVSQVLAQLPNVFKEVMVTLKKKGSRRNNKLMILDKYYEADNCVSNPNEATLILVEGDSAMGQVNNCVMRLGKTLGPARYGRLSLGGVIMNVRKHYTMEVICGKRVFTANKKAQENVFLNKFLKVTGLEVGASYDPEDITYDVEISKLRYGSIVACVDQDLDGIGKIFGLVLNMFDYFWPNLIKAGYLKRFATPIMRAYPNAGGIVEDFYTQDEFNNWASTNDAEKYSIKYFKGLASSNDEDSIQMFRMFHKKLYTYQYDQDAEKIIDVYFGESANARKLQLSSVVTLPEHDIIDQQEKTLRIECSDHLLMHTDAYQRDTISRAIDSVADGFNQSARKIFYTARSHFKSTTASEKVITFAGEVIRTAAYHHGEGTLTQSISLKAQHFVGAKQLPVLLPDGALGTRSDPSSYGAPRYVSVMYNKELCSVLYPLDDDILLTYNVDDNKFIEPKYYLPIIPTCICENASIPAHGWKYKVWGRDVNAVIKATREMVASDHCDITSLVLPLNTYGHAGRVVTDGKGCSYTMGEYTVIDDYTIQITELPICNWTCKYEAHLKKLYDGKFITLYKNRSTSDRIDIIVTLVDTVASVKKIHACNTFDGIENYLDLKKSLTPNINYFGVNNEVLMYDCYEKVYGEWYPLRRQCYIDRVERIILEYEVTIQMHENIIRYLKDYHDLGFRDKDVPEIREILIGKKFDKIHTAIIKNSKGITNAEYKNKVLHGPKASHDYLLNLNGFDLAVSGIVKYEKKLAKLNQELVEYKAHATSGMFYGQKLWLEELNKLEKVIADGRRTQWKFKNAGKYKYRKVDSV